MSGVRHPCWSCWLGDTVGFNDVLVFCDIMGDWLHGGVTGREKINVLITLTAADLNSRKEMVIITIHCIQPTSCGYQ